MHSNGRDKQGRYLPGAVQNPKGRPKCPDFVRKLNSALQEPVPGDLTGRTAFDVLVGRLISEACDGNLYAAKLILDRTNPVNHRIDVNTQVDPDEAHNLIDQLTLLLPVDARKHGIAPPTERDLP